MRKRDARALEKKRSSDKISQPETSLRQIHFSHDHDVNCEICANKKSFAIHHSLVEEFRRGNVVIFAGAGISTENRSVMSFTLFDDVCGLMKLDRTATSFPEAMQTFSDQPNGRLELITKIRERFDYIDSFPELRRNAARFHDELATLYNVDTIITTNWDTLFERRCAAQPFVVGSDFPFWDASPRRVLKIHGSITNLGSIIATANDYVQSSIELEKGVLGGFLKTLLSTKTVVFAGYSARDEDFNQVLRYIRGALGGLGRQHYVVTLETSDAAIDRFKDLGLTPITTDATFFIESIKEHLQGDSHFIPDTLYDEVDLVLGKLGEAHTELYEKFNCFNDPEIVLCGSYQDGMMHALERVLNLRPSGHYSHRCNADRLVAGYENIKKQKLKNKRYADVAYIEGYQNGMLLVATHGQRDKTNLPPLYFLYAKPEPFQLKTFSLFKRALKDLRKNGWHHKGAYREAVSATAHLSKKDAQSIIIHHKCQLY